MIYKFYNLKVAICTIAKKENLYIKEYVDYYIKLGVDHIFIYDNNDENTEKISDIIDKSYKYYVTIYDSIKDNFNNRSLTLTTCYKNNNNNFDWIFINDIDEYLIIKNDTLKNYLSNKIFKKCKLIKINMLQDTDNNLIYYENKPLFERFKGPYENTIYSKYFFRNNIKDFYYNIDFPSSCLRNLTCNCTGKKTYFNELFDNSNYDKAYIIHYKFKSTEEFINKLRRDYSKWFDYNYLENRIEEYFKYNKINLEKVQYIEEQLKLNLSIYKKDLYSLLEKNKPTKFLSIKDNKKKIKNKLKKNLVIGVFANYNWEVVEPFFISFKRVGFENCDCIIFVNDIDLETKIKIEILGVIIYEVPDKFKNYGIINYRWKIYEYFIKNNKDKYNIIFTTDLRDSFFQKDIFKYYNNQKSYLGIAIEDGIISYDKYNKEWILNAYGENVLNKIGNERIMCAGTVWGTADKFYEFSKIMWEKLSSEWSIKLNAVDQGVANFLIYYAKIFNECLIKSDNQNGFVMTLALTKRENIKLDSDNNILNGKGEIAAVIHQYDRKADIIEIVKKKYSFNFNSFLSY